LVMAIAKWAKHFISEADFEAISKAVAREELKTSGEIVPMVVRRSSAIGHVPVLLTLILWIPTIYYFSAQPLYFWVAAIASVVLGYVLGSRGWVQRYLISAMDQRSQVYARAELEFHRLNLETTTGRTGILIFLSLMEHQAVVLADQGIASKLPPEIWKGVIDVLVDCLKRGDVVAGMTRAIQKCGGVLAENFPRLEGDANELTNHLVLKD